MLVLQPVVQNILTVVPNLPSIGNREIQNYSKHPRNIYMSKFAQNSRSQIVLAAEKWLNVHFFGLFF
jgi:hypothetical protein